MPLIVDPRLYKTTKSYIFWVSPRRGILLYEMIYGRALFRRKNRHKIFSNILNKDLTFPSSMLLASRRSR
ncbi:hypothetical protein P3L10_019079 [Capsicum annuum]